MVIAYSATVSGGSHIAAPKSINRGDDIYICGEFLKKPEDTVCGRPHECLVRECDLREEVVRLADEVLQLMGRISKVEAEIREIVEDE